MKLFRTVVGIDPSGQRLALSAVRFVAGRPAAAAPPVVCELRAEKEQARMEEAERLLLDFVTRNGLAGSDARLAIPADKVFLARVQFPPLKDKDMRTALSMELDRIFPVPASEMKFNWRRRGTAAGDVPGQVVAAASAGYVGLWEEMASRAGLSMAGAVPSCWALSAARRGIGEASPPEGEIGALLRDLDGSAECVVMDGGEPFFSALRACPPESAPAEALSLLASALVDSAADGVEKGVAVVAPDEWRTVLLSAPEAGVRFTPVEGFERRAAEAMAVPDGGGGSAMVWGSLGAFGAAISDKELDLLSPEKEGAGMRRATGAAVAALAAAVVVLGIAWPSTVLLRAKQEVRRLDGEIASMRPAVARVESSLAALSGLEGRIAVLREANAGRDEPVVILRQLTDRLPQGTWLTGLRVEGRKVEMEGLSPSANEIFPLLSRDGQFRKVEFASPITRQADNMERFQIRAEYSPVAQQKPGGGSR